MNGTFVTTLEGAHRIVTADAVDDMSSFIMEDWLDAGFRECVWEYGYEPYQDEKMWREMGSVCPVCFALDGQHFKVQWLLENMRHNAPKYTLSHVNCKCRLRRVPRQKEVLDYSEEMIVPPSAVPEEMRVGPAGDTPPVIDVNEIGEQKARELGIPPNPMWTKWTWDPGRNEFLPYTGRLGGRWLERRGGVLCR